MNLDDAMIEKLIEKALEIREKAYARYSDFLVGAAVLGEDGNIYTGCNIENVSYAATICAERTAIYNGVCNGCTSFQAIAIVGARRDGEMDYCYPCGICRQVMLQFAKKRQFKIILTNEKREYKIYTLAQLLPGAFDSF